jgi:predicted RNA binding protein YcfA (HicA-like mRNA interferase family)
MSRREKLLDKMRNTPGNIRFTEVDALLRFEDFVLFNKRGSHRTYHHADGRVITIVVPHGRHNTCHPSDIRRFLRVLGQ